MDLPAGITIGYDVARAESFAAYKGRRLPYPTTMPFHNRLAIKLPPKLLNARWNIEWDANAVFVCITLLTPQGKPGKIGPIVADETFPTDELITQLIMVLA